LGLCLFAMLVDGGWPIILYGLGAVCVYYIGQNNK